MLRRSSAFSLNKGSLVIANRNPPPPAPVSRNPEKQTNTREYVNYPRTRVKSTGVKQNKTSGVRQSEIISALEALQDSTNISDTFLSL